MQSLSLSLSVTCLLCLIYACTGRPNPELDLLDEDRIARDIPGEADLTASDLRKLLLKKLRFREIINRDMLSPGEILEGDREPMSEDRHISAKRHQVDDLMSKVKALLSGIKERQIKDALQLPSLRFGRSGFHLGKFQ